MATYSDARCPLASHVLCKTRATFMLLLFIDATTVTIFEKQNVNKISYAIKMC